VARQIVNVTELIDARKIGALQIRAFVLCAAVLLVDGFDVQGITYVAPALSQAWSLRPGALGPTFSAGLFGVMLGALAIAPLADRIGRRHVIVWSCVAFGFLTLATPLMRSLTPLLVLRFFTGLGLGAAIPNAIALASEYAPKRHKASLVMFVSSGISIGAIAVGMIAARVISTTGWKGVFIAGGVLPLTLAVALYIQLPESIRFLAALPGARAQAEAKRLLREIKRDLAPDDADIRVQSTDKEAGRATVVDLFKEQRGTATVLIWIAFFMSLLNVYLAISWLPTSLTALGFTGVQAAVITSMYHVGGVLGTYACGLLMDKLGARAILVFAFLLAVGGFYTFATAPAMSQLNTTLLLMATGCGVIGGQVGITTLASMIYPVAIRSTGLGWALGVGRVGSIIGPTVGGLMLKAAVDARQIYLFCVAPALIGALCVALLRWRASPRLESAEGL
jgi:AAHS family 4-hydroxybenzoate transporter-like MFS transporter